MRKLQVKDVLTRIKEPIELEDDVEYAQVTVRLKHQGVCLRGHKFGKEIGTKKQSIVRGGQFILSKIDARNGAFGIIPDELDGAIITNDFLNYEVNEKELNIELFRLLTSQSTFDELCNASSTGTTNRKRLNEKVFLEQEITLPPIEEQNSFIEHFKKLQEKHSQTLEELQTQSELINKLRSSILSDAVSGKLVPQDPNDESAEVLLEKIKAEKEKLIKDGKLKKQKPLPPINEDEIPYELPNGWIWCRLDDICRYIQRGKSPKYTEKNTRIPIIAQKCVQWKEIQMYKCQYLDLTKFETYTKERLLRNNDILWNSTGLGTLGRVNIFQHEKKYKIVVADSHVSVIRTMKKFIDSKYIYKFLLSPFVQNEIENKSSGSTKQSELGLNTIKNHLVPLPPLKEQKRIVEKVEKLTHTCDALELEVQNSKAETEKLMQSVLKEAL
ncbi:MAG: restriction endonuclease subunit S [Sulfurimonas sp.]|nr:restriction endonuclease subunit S [Sulfurimonas sp.]